MGRESRLARRPEPRDDPAGENRGLRSRRLVATNACLALLAQDRRVQAHFRTWLLVERQRNRDGPPSWVRSSADVQRAIAELREADIDALAAVLRDMGVPWRWCAYVLVTVSFPVMRHNLTARSRSELHVVQGTVESHGLPRGRAPREGGKGIRQWVHWWYRHHVLAPPDPVHVLAAEYVAAYTKTANRSPEAHSVVLKGISKAIRLLNVEIRPQPEAEPH
jgi:hypothetical protein